MRMIDDLIRAENKLLEAKTEVDNLKSAIPGNIADALSTIQEQTQLSFVDSLKLISTVSGEIANTGKIKTHKTCKLGSVKSHKKCKIGGNVKPNDLVEINARIKSAADPVKKNLYRASCYLMMNENKWVKGATLRANGIDTTYLGNRKRINRYIPNGYVLTVRRGLGYKVANKRFDQLIAPSWKCGHDRPSGGTTTRLCCWR